MGWVIARNLAWHFGSVDALDRRDPVPARGGRGEADRAVLIAEWFADEENRALVQELRDLGIQMEGERDELPAEGPLTGRQYVITGTLEGFKREEAKAALEALGAKVSESVSSKTTGLWSARAPAPRPPRRREARHSDPVGSRIVGATRNGLGR